MSGLLPAALPMAPTPHYTLRIITASAVFLLLAALVYLLATKISFFLLVFAGLLLAVLLSALANWLARVLQWQRGWALALAVVLVVGLVFLSFWLMAPTLDRQLEEIVRALPHSIKLLELKLMDYRLGRKLVNELNANSHTYLPSLKSVLSRVPGVFSSTLDVIADVLIILITGIFLSVNPLMYQREVVNLFPPRYRTRMFEVLHACYTTLKLWLAGKFFSMVIIGVFTGIGLELLGMPLAYALALIAFFITFIPTIGPYLSAVPAVLIAMMEGSDMVLYVILLYLGVQLVETYFLTPLIYQRTVKIPPAITLFSQVFLGIFAGILGLLLAAPLVAVLRVLIRELYIRDYLEKRKPTTGEAAPEEAS